jgi:hypothetical protein
MNLLWKSFLHLLCLGRDLPVVNGAVNETDMTFLVMSDLHDFTPFAYKKTLEDIKQMNLWEASKAALSAIKATYGGELVLIPGDSASFGKISNEVIKKELGKPGYSMNEVVYEATSNVYKAVKAMYNEVGYDTVLAAVGDHEIGGNKGFKAGKKSKVSTVPSYRKGFSDGYSSDADGNFLFTKKIGNADSRPLGTIWESTSYAYVQNNCLFITIDAFKSMGDDKNYIDRKKGRGGEGIITCDVDGKHLEWFEEVLVEAGNDDTIQHIFVQAHLPIIQPVRKVHSSGQFMDNADESTFWQVMNKHKVDVYFAGDVHSNTASVARDPKSEVVQVVSRGNPFNNFLQVETTPTSIDITLLNEVGFLPTWNLKYEEYGKVSIDKSLAKRSITSSGELKLLNPDAELIRFDFEEMPPLGTRQVRFAEDYCVLLIELWAKTNIQTFNKLCFINESLILLFFLSGT